MDPDADRTLVFQLPGKKFYITTVHKLVAVMEKACNMQKQLGNVRRLETKKESKGNVRNKNTVRELKNMFDRLISRLDTT